MSAYTGVPEATLVLFVCSSFLISPSSSSPHIQNDNRPVALLLPNGNIVPSPNSQKFDPDDQKPALLGFKPSKGSSCSLLSADFSNQRKEGFPEVQSRDHGTNNIPNRTSRHIRPERVWNDFSNLPNSQPQSSSCQYQTEIHHKNTHCYFGQSQTPNLNHQTRISSISNHPCSYSHENTKQTCCTEFNGFWHPKVQKIQFNIDENLQRTQELSMEHDDLGHENIYPKRQRKVEIPPFYPIHSKADSLRARGPENFKSTGSDSIDPEPQCEESYCLDGDAERPVREFPDRNSLSRFGREESDVNSTPGNPFSTEDGSAIELLVGNKSMFCVPVRIRPLAPGTMPCALQSPFQFTLPLQAPWCLPCNHCLPLNPRWIPEAPTIPGQGAIVAWGHRIGSPQWSSSVPSGFPPSPPLTPEEPFIFSPVVFANHFSSPLMGPFVHTGTAVTDAEFMYFEVLLNILSSTSAVYFLPLEQLNIVGLQDFIDQLPLLIDNGLCAPPHLTTYYDPLKFV